MFGCLLVVEKKNSVIVGEIFIVIVLFDASEKVVDVVIVRIKGSRRGEDGEMLKGWRRGIGKRTCGKTRDEAARGL